ncbi:sigma factor-like helix-turn-helix DNA-binding protein [Mordavella massiliensis]|uniref:Sigma-70 family RNA polymerase sigma factor n=1 Tax=Mordavella massiliensis TaxID=1871024 RepID=A0A938X9Z3_9CLOT|nr:sigma factor-like helix-turn-helix DNA-binding protein [Mordavella massiliensis]MBM6947202.1 sigma-70 family RNA polymerase sigma factor [Mordavella massiliensis]
MAYNKALAEKIWRQRKEAEEETLRRLGMDEERILDLRAYDWDLFKAERRFQEHRADWPVCTGGRLREMGEEPGSYFWREEAPYLSEDMDRLLDRLDGTGKKILDLKIKGYETREISAIIGITEKAVYRRMDRIREKIKNF